MYYLPCYRHLVRPESLWQHTDVTEKSRTLQTGIVCSKNRLHAKPAGRFVRQNDLRLYFHLILLKISEYDHTILAYMGILKNVRNSNKYFA